MQQIAKPCERLAEALAQNKMRAVDLSEKTGISKANISRYLSGKFVPKADSVYKMALVLSVNEMWLWGYDAPMERTKEQKRNDDLVQAVAQLREDPDFADLVLMLSKLPPAEYTSVKVLLSSLVKN